MLFLTCFSTIFVLCLVLFLLVFHMIIPLYNASNNQILIYFKFAFK